jgi:chromate transport protein ChrA
MVEPIVILSDAVIMLVVIAILLAIAGIVTYGWWRGVAGIIIVLVAIWLMETIRSQVPILDNAITTFTNQLGMFACVANC